MNIGTRGALSKTPSLLAMVCNSRGREWSRLAQLRDVYLSGGLAG